MSQQAQRRIWPSQEDKNRSANNKQRLGFHRDFLKRPLYGYDISDKSLNPYDGRLCNLSVQCSEGVLSSDSEATWRRNKVRNGSSWIIRLANWALSRDHGSEDKVKTDVITAMCRWLPACIALSVVISLPIQAAATPSNFGRFDSFLYKDWRYPRDARNKLENKDDTHDPSQRTLARNQRGLIPGTRKRLSEPDYLCFLDADGKVIQHNVSEWTQSKGKTTSTSYVFLSFTVSQFSDREDDLALLDHDFLDKVGLHAAQTVGADAYWCSTSCLARVFKKGHEKTQEEEEIVNQETQQSVWNMSDIIRRAKAIVIALAGELDAQFNGESLRAWGERFWTMPELLLYTGDHPIYIYEKLRGPNNPRQLPRRELWNKAWSDTAYSGQLIDHYEGSLMLSPLELNTIALHCLQNRFVSKKYLEGDIAYILMGLLRHRPEVNASDNEFQAFARLSLANDSNLLLERMICLLPKSHDAEWWSMEDVWHATLWDIYPKIQICGIGEGNTIILDGAHGAAIRWREFVPVLTLGQETKRHGFARAALRMIPIFLFTGIVWVAAGQTLADENRTAVLVPGCIVLVLAAVAVLLSPVLVHQIYCTPTHNSQPFFFGIEGYVDKYGLELLIFGSYENRLSWSTAGSPLSRHKLDTEGMHKDFPDLDEESASAQNMYTGLDPVNSDEEVEKKVESSKKSSNREMKVFTLVDTYTMTITLFEAVRPPIAVIMCGAEGGMQRALLCSEDWKTGTLYRETVLRMETRVWDKMDTVARIRLGLKRDDTDVIVGGK
ncbi:MAG: hypothetical protein Q9179_007313, partial [Wetmoreana sp. 5 TL-2023]